MKDEHWQIRMFNKSLKKKEKLQILSRVLDLKHGMVLLDLGCAKGTLSFFMRRMGGIWVSADTDSSNLIATRELVEKAVIQIEPYRLPFRDRSFDAIVSFDFLEHIEKDKLSLSEMNRILKSGGTIYLSTPVSGAYFFNWLRRMVGLGPEVYGHVREGYTVEKLRNMFAGFGYQADFAERYSGFFTELIETAINFLFLLKSKRKEKTKRDGFITPGTSDEFNANEKAFRMYSLVYPFMFAISKLDKLLRGGYCVVLKAQKVLP